MGGGGLEPKGIRGSRENRERKWLPWRCDKGSRPREDRSARINYNRPEEHSVLRHFFRPLHATYSRLSFPQCSLSLFLSLRVRLAKRNLPRRRKKCCTEEVLVVRAHTHTQRSPSFFPPGISACTRARVYVGKRLSLSLK